MSGSLLIRGCGLIVLMLSPVMAGAPKEEAETVVIPMDRIRHGASAFNHLRELEPEIFDHDLTAEEREYFATPQGAAELAKRYKRSVLYQIDRAITSMLEEPNTRAGFAVVGTDRKALEGIYDVLVKGDTPNKRFQAGSEISVVFFTRPMQPGVQLKEVELTGNVVKVHYAFVPRTEAIVTHYLALIPLGDLPPGRYRVEMIRIASEAARGEFVPSVDPGIEESIVCKPFSFLVTEKTRTRGETR